MNQPRTRVSRLLLAIGSLGLSLPLAAAPIEIKTGPGAPPTTPELQMAGDAIQLPLDQALEIALRQNLGLVVERFNRAQARQSIFQTQGIYDLLATANLNHDDSQLATSSRLFASQSETDRFDFSLSQLLPSGADVSLGWANSRSETNSIFADFNPSYSSTPTFSLRQPLLRNFGRMATDFNILIARTNDTISREQFETQVANILQLTENAYWDLVESREQLKVAEESLALTRELHEQNRVRVDVGTLAPLELIQSEAGIAVRDEEIIRARARVGDAEDNLRRLLALAQGDLWNKSITPSTSPEVEPQSVDLEAMISTALQERPELASQRLVVENRKLEAAFFSNQRKPQLDLNASYGLSGVGGTLRSDPDTGAPLGSPIRGGFDDALDQVTGFDFPSWSIGLSLSVPIQNRAARARSTIADLELEKAEAALEELEQTVITEVRTAARGVETASQVIASARVSSRLAEKNLEAERKRYENGMSTSFQILEIQEDLTTARSREVTAVTGYRRALAEFHRAIGRLLEENGVTLDDELAAM